MEAHRGMGGVSLLYVCDDDWVMLERRCLSAFLMRRCKQILGDILL
jgi:hypothetical protein